MNIPIVASLGMGLDSSVMVDRWLADLTSRDFELSDLIVISSQVGLEDQETGRQMEELLFPRLRASSVRTVQIARRGPRQADGIVVLDDTREPTRCFATGSGYTLYDELISAGTVPQYANGQRRCSLKLLAEGDHPAGTIALMSLVGERPGRALAATLRRELRRGGGVNVVAPPTGEV